MEADSMHATIERKIKNRYIYLPGDYTDWLLKKSLIQNHNVCILVKKLLEYGLRGLIILMCPGPLIGGRQPCLEQVPPFVLVAHSRTVRYYQALDKPPL